MHPRVSTALFFLAFLGACMQAAPTTVPIDMPKIALAEFDRTVLATTDSRVLWSSVELIEPTRGHRAASSGITFR